MLLIYVAGYIAGLVGSIYFKMGEHLIKPMFEKHVSSQNIRDYAVYRLKFFPKELIGSKKVKLR